MKDIIKGFLKDNNIPFDEITHNPVFTMVDMKNEKIDTKCTLCKNLFLRDAKGKRHFLITASDESNIDLARLGNELGTKLSFASQRRIDKYLGSFGGCISALGIIFDKESEVEIILDDALIGKEKIGLHPNVNTYTLIISEADLEQYITLSQHSFIYKKFK